MKVIGLGDQVVDKYEHTHIMYPGGNALNFAVFAKQMGVESAFLGAFGNTEEGMHVKNTIESLGIDVSHSRVYEGENGHAYVTLKEGDRVFIGSNQCGVLKKIGLNLSEEDYRYLMGFDVIHSGLYGFAEKELKELSRRGCCISFDFSNDFTEEKLKRLLPVIKYSFFSTGHMTDDKRFELEKRAISEGNAIVLCTCGERGAYLYDGEREYHQKPHYVRPKDTMAAGDSFITSFLLNYLKLIEQMGHDIAVKKALEIAAFFSAEQCMIDGSFGHGKKY